MSSLWLSLLRKDALAKTVFLVTFADAKANKQHLKSHVALLSKSLSIK